MVGEMRADENDGGWGVEKEKGEGRRTRRRRRKMKGGDGREKGDHLKRLFAEFAWFACCPTCFFKLSHVMTVAGDQLARVIM